MCPVDVPTAKFNPSNLDDSAVTATPLRPIASSTPGSAFESSVALDPDMARSLEYGSRKIPARDLDLGSHISTVPLPASVSVPKHMS
jgi:hypothetical protein